MSDYWVLVVTIYPTSIKCCYCKSDNVLYELLLKKDKNKLPRCFFFTWPDILASFEYELKSKQNKNKTRLEVLEMCN